ncbi:MAG: hypothetical protein V4725_06925 [Bacteroidota bacterium]
MNSESISSSKPKSNSTLGSIAAIVLVAGTADILAALIQYFIATGKNPTVVLKFIASGIFGSRAFSAGNDFIFWGLVFHYLIVLIWTIIFVITYPFVFPLVRNRWLFAVLIAICIWLVMNFLVLPLSQTPPMPIQMKSAIISFAILFFAVGTPLSLLLYRHYN